MSQPHDGLFHKTFSIPEETASVLKVHLPKALVAEVDWDSLAREEGKFVDEALSGRQSDLLFSCRYRGVEASLYLLYEHQSSEDPLMPYRLAEYILRILRRDQDRKPGSEPRPVIPVVLAQTGSHWKQPTRFSALFPTTLQRDPQLRAAHLDFAYHLIDLGRVEVGGTHYRPVARLTLHLMQFARTPGAPFAAAFQVDLWHAVPKHTHAQFWHYLFNLRHLDRQSMKAEILAMQDETLRETGMSFAEYLLAEGEAKGEARGELKGRLEHARSAVIKCAEARFGEVPYSVHEYIAGETSLERLDAAIVAAARAESLDTFLRALGLSR